MSKEYHYILKFIFVLPQDIDKKKNRGVTPVFLLFYKIFLISSDFFNFADYFLEIVKTDGVGNRMIRREYISPVFF